MCAILCFIFFKIIYMFICINIYVCVFVHIQDNKWHFLFEKNNIVETLTLIIRKMFRSPTKFMCMFYAFHIELNEEIIPFECWLLSFSFLNAMNFPQDKCLGYVTHKMLIISSLNIDFMFSKHCHMYSSLFHKFKL